MSFSRKGCGTALCLALTVLMPTVYAKDVVAQISVQENAAVPAAKDDFYLHVNSDWLKTTKIPADEGRYDRFTELADKTRGQLTEITKDAVQKQKQGTANADEARIAAFNACILDQKGRDAAGLGKLAEPLRRIEAIKTTQEYAETMSDLCREYGIGGGMVGSFGPGNDPFKNDRYVVFLGGPSAGLGRERMGEGANEVYQGYYRDYLRDLLVLYGRSPEAATKSAASIFAMEKDIALHSLTVGESADPSKTLNRLKLAELKKLYNHLDIAAVLDRGGIGPKAGINTWYVMDKGAIARFNELCTAENLPTMKEQAIAVVLEANASYLTKAYQQVEDHFGQQMSGAVSERSAERKNQELNEAILSNTYGRLYAARYFSEKKREMIQGYLKLVMDEYKKKLTNLDWMSDKTKQQAFKKLDHMAVNIGAPSAWPEYMENCRPIRPEQGGTLVDNVFALRQLEAAYAHDKIGKPIRKDLWEDMMPQTVNAFYSQQDNSINFPAAILQKPFFDQDADQAVNLGGIGMVMAHEVTHSFDSSGAQFDEQGRLHNWWTKEDYAEFKKRQTGIIKFYDRYVLPDGTRLNGTQTLTENIADLGAMSCLSDIVGHDKEKLRRMYTNFAVIWQNKLSDAMLQAYLSDIHSLPAVRVNAVLSSTAGFYGAYGVQPGDGMYVAPEERARLW